jgi:hypothetical protein
MPPLQAISATALMLAAKFVTLEGIVAGRGSVAHSGQLRRGEKLELSHRIIISYPARMVLLDPMIDHAKF